GARVGGHEGLRDRAPGDRVPAVAGAARAQGHQAPGGGARPRRRLLGDVARADAHGADDPDPEVRPRVRLRDGDERLHGELRPAGQPVREPPGPRQARPVESAHRRRAEALVSARGLAFLGAVAGVLFGAGIARADTPAPGPGPAPGDSLLHDYVRQMRDSTDRWFGITAAPVDTAGLDSALAAGLLRSPNARLARGQRKLSFDWGPALGFNRADGGQLGASASLGTRWLSGLSGRMQYTTGTHDLLGEGAWAHSWRIDPLRARLGLRLGAGRYTLAFDRDYYEPILTSLNALFAGEDRHHYLRRDGFVSNLRLSAESGFATLSFRDQLESSLPYTTDWYLFGHGPVLPFNDTAAVGRVSELGFGGDVTIPGTRFRVNANYWTSDPRLGSDMLYRRTRVTAGGDVSLGRHFALVPQATYGYLRGETPPQEAFFLGGVANVR